ACEGHVEEVRWTTVIHVPRENELPRRIDREADRTTRDAEARRERPRGSKPDIRDSARVERAEAREPGEEEVTVLTRTSNDDLRLGTLQRHGVAVAAGDRGGPTAPEALVDLARVREPKHERAWTALTGHEDAPVAEGANVIRKLRRLRPIPEHP